MASNYPPRKKDDEKRRAKVGSVEQRTAAKRKLEAETSASQYGGGPNNWFAREGTNVHARAVLKKARDRYKKEGPKRSIFGDVFFNEDDKSYKNLGRARKEFEQEAGERRRQRAIGAKARTSRQARFLASEKKTSAARARKTNRRAR